MPKQPFILKGEMTLLNVLMLQSSDLGEINTLLQQKRVEVSQLLSKSPIIVDCQAINDDCQNLNLESLHSIIVEADFVPVGLRNLPEELEPDAINAGWAILRKGGIVREQVQQTVSQSDTDTEADEHSARASQRLILLDKPVRSGQQVYAQDGDIVVLQQTSAGSELLAAGSVHVYGPLRGRVLAGIHGDVSARIFCQKLEAELVAIAGRYRLLEDDNPLKDKPAMIYLEGEKLIIDPMF